MKPRQVRVADSLFDSRLALGAAGVCAVAVGVMGVLYWQRPAVAPHAPPAQAASAWDNPIGPGLLAAPPRELATPQAAAPVARDTRIALDTGGHLVVNLALRTLFDAFIARGKGAQGADAALELRAYLNGRLAAPAAQEAQHLVGDYLAYRDAEAQLRASARFAPPGPSGLSERDVAQLLAWQQQRAQLRQRMLGAVVAQAWFELEDAGCAAALGDWQKQRDPQVPDEEPDSVTLRERRVHGAMLDARREFNAQACASQIREGLAAPNGPR